MKFAEAMGSVKKWAESTVAGFGAMARWQRSQAARHFLNARDELGEASDADARSAAAHSNAGVGFALLGRMPEALRAFDAAEQCWLDVAGTLRTVEIPVSGRSSAFHFRLAAQNISAFEAAHRRRYEQLCEAGLAITRFNRLFACTTPPDEAVPEACATLTTLLSDALGPQSPGVRLLSQAARGMPASDDGRSAYSDKLAEIAALERVPAAALPPVCRHLEFAVAVTALFPPHAYPSPRSVACEAPGQSAASRQTATLSNS